jgi:alpha-beta hydrolase superfamily lysophospholipase
MITPSIFILVLTLSIYYFGWTSKKSSSESWNIAPNFRGIKTLEKYSGNYFQNSHGLWLHYYFYPSTTNEPSKATVAMIHGLGGMNEGFHSLAEKLTKLGIDVYTMEYSGWGHSEGDRGYFGEEGVQDLFSDFNTFLDFIKQKQTEFNNPNKLICLGKSAGGLTVLHSTVYNHSCQDGIILLAPALNFHKDRISAFQNTILTYLSLVFPKVPVALKEWKVTMRAGSAYSLLQYLAHGVDKLESMLSDKNTRFPPYLIVQGKADITTDEKRVDSFVEKIPATSQGKYVKLPGLTHDLEKEESVRIIVIEWIKSTFLNNS